MNRPAKGKDPTRAPGPQPENQIAGSLAEQLLAIRYKVSDLSTPRAHILQAIDAMIREEQERVRAQAGATGAAGKVSQAVPDRTAAPDQSIIVALNEDGLTGRELLRRACLIVSRMVSDPRQREWLVRHACSLGPPPDAMPPEEFFRGP